MSAGVMMNGLVESMLFYVKAPSLALISQEMREAEERKSVRNREEESCE